MANNDQPKEPVGRFKEDFYDFLAWYLTPQEFREDDEKTILDYTTKHKINRRKVYNWMKTPLFVEEVDKHYKKNLKSKTQNIIDALYAKAMEGDVPAIKLFAQWQLQWSEKTKVEVENKISLTDFHKARKAAEEKTNAKK